jgi:anti-sigma factor RsiW
MRRPGGHLGGSTVTALVDGQVPLAESERVWRHVVCCGSCRAAVEREAWVKSRLAGLSPIDPPLGFGAAIAGLPVGEERFGAGPAGWTGDLDDCRRGRRMGIVAVGVGSVGAAVLGLTAVSGVVDLREPPPAGTTIRGGVTGSPEPTPRPSPGPASGVLEPAVRLSALPHRDGRRTAEGEPSLPTSAAAR